MVAPDVQKRVTGRSRPFSVALAALAVVACTQAEAAENGASGDCAKAEAFVIAEIKSAKRGKTLRRLGPWVSGDGAAEIAARAVGPGGEALAFDAYLGAGLSRQAQALRVLLEKPPPASPVAKLGHSAALLALGDGSETGTIAGALRDVSPRRRRIAVAALSGLRHKRPIAFLQDALEDPDESVRLLAARALMADGSARARRVVEQLATKGTHPGLRLRAARVMFELGRVRSDLAESMPEPLRGRAIAAVIARNKKSAARHLYQDLRSGEPDRRAGALAGVAIGETPSRLKKLVEKPMSHAGADGSAELAMALALRGDDEALVRLQGLDRPGVARAAAVLWAYSGAGLAGEMLEEEIASKLARVIEGWLVANVPSPQDASRILRAMEALDPASAATLARTRLLGPDNRGLRTAFRVLARHGNERDVSPVLIAARRVANESTRAEGARAAARICAR